MIKQTYKNGKWYQDGVLMDPQPESKFKGETLPKTNAQWPVYCDACGVHPDQITEAKEFLADRGVPTDFLPDGRTVLRDRMHRRKVLKAMGYVDRSSYTGY
jgi:hypothetical protein